MAEVIDSLQVEIGASAAEAAKGIGVLTSALKRAASQVSGIVEPLKAISAALDNMKSMTNGVGPAMTKISTALSAFKAIPAPAITSIKKITAQLESMNTTSNKLQDSNSSINQLNTTLARLAVIGDLKVHAQALRRFGGLDFSPTTNSLRELITEMERLRDAIPESLRPFLAIGLNAKYSDKIKGVKEEYDSLGKSLEMVQKATGAKRLSLFAGMDQAKAGKSLKEKVEKPPENPLKDFDVDVAERVSPLIDDIRIKLQSAAVYQNEVKKVLSTNITKDIDPSKLKAVETSPGAAETATVGEEALESSVVIGKSRDDLVAAMKVAAEQLNIASNEIEGIKTQVSAEDFKKLGLEEVEKGISADINIDDLSPDLKNAEDITSRLKTNFVDVSLNLADAGKNLRALVTEANTLSGALKGSDGGVSDIKGAMKGVNSELKKGDKNFSTLFKHVSQYRLVRVMLRQAFQMAQEGLNQYVKTNEGANESASKLLSVYNGITAVLGVFIGTLMQAVEPILTSVGDILIDLVNRINEFFAALSGQTSYSKVIKQNADYAASIADVNGQLFEFDKFTTMSGNNQPAMFETVETSLSGFGSSLNVFESLQDIFGVMLDAVSELLPLVSVLLEVLAPIVSIWLKLASILGKAVWGIIGGIIKGITDGLQSLWDLLSPHLMPAMEWIDDLLTKISTGLDALKNGLSGLSPQVRILLNVLGLLITTLGTVAIMATIARGALTGGKLLLAELATLAVGVGLMTTLVNNTQKATKEIAGYASGGIMREDGFFHMSKGEVVGTFYDGTSFMANQHKGESTFANVAYTGTIQALHDYANLKQPETSSDNNSPLEVAFNVDGRTLARTVYPHIKAEHVRVGGVL
jgi:hypothetical protein